MHSIDPEDKSRPVIRGHASIIHTEITVKVLWRRQLDVAIDYLLENNIPFDWDIVEGDSLTQTTYTLTVFDIPWANNLTAFSKILESCDYQSDLE